MDENRYPDEEALAAELRTVFEKNESPVILPPSLTEEAVAQQLKGVISMEENTNPTGSATPKKTKKISNGAKTVIGIGIAAALAFGLLGIANRIEDSRIVAANEQNVVTQSTAVAEQNKTEAEETQTDYDGILSIVKRYAEEQNEIMRKNSEDNSVGLLDRIEGFFGSGSSKSADVAAIEEEVMEDNGFYYTDSAVDTTIAAAALPATATTATAETTAASGDYGETNVQTEGVDEADILKNDGKYLYLLRDGTVYICLSYPAQEMKIAAEIRVEDDAGDDIQWGYANEMFLYNGKLTVIYTGTSTEGEDDENGYRYSRTKAVIYDVTNPEKPSVLQTFGQDGWYQSSRITDGCLLLVTTYDGFLYWTYDENTECSQYAVDEDRVIPKTYIGDAGTCVAADAASAYNEEQPDSFTVVSAKNLDDLTAPVSSASALGGGCEVYCSADALYVAQYLYDWDDDYVKYGLVESTFSASTRITAFDLQDGKIVKGASGCVPGTPNGQFSMDAYNGYFRIATQDWNSEIGNAVYVLDENLQTVGSVTGIAPDESIQAVRFIGETAYVVTFLQTDPLFVIDLSDPANPFIAGEVKLPGFSSYLHPVGDGLLLGVGTGGDEEGTDGSAKLSLFDVSDPVSPKEISSVVISDAYFTTNSRAFCDCGENGWLIPYTRYATVEHTEGNNSYVDMRYFGGAVRVLVEDGKLTVAQRYEQSDFEGDRTTYIADTVYSFSAWNENNMLVAFDMADGSIVGSLQAPEQEYTDTTDVVYYD